MFILFVQPCRFGISCTNKLSCRFGHPALPSAAKLRWTSQSAAAAKMAQQAAQKAAIDTSPKASAAVTKQPTAVVAPTAAAAATHAVQR